MPTTYAHYRFGQDVKSNLKDDAKKLIDKNINLYNIGLHGPDILFYYKPLNRNKVNKTGTFLHENKAESFFQDSINVINTIDDKEIKEACLSYVYGFICHFTLDSAAHKYINIETKKRNISHYEMEAEFDRILLTIDNLDPIKTRLTSHIVANDFNADVISRLFSDISKEEIESTLKSMVFYLNILVAPSNLKRNTIYAILKLSGHYEDMHGLIINKKANSYCIETNNILTKIYKDRIKKAQFLINNYTESFNNNSKLDIEFKRTFEA